MTDRIGQQLGNYRLSRLLGRGGFAEVYLGEHVYLKTPAAIKLLQGKLANEQDLQAFLKEAQTIAQLVHPHIVRVLDFGVDGETPFLVMDYAMGGTLRQRHPRGTPLSFTTIVLYIKQVAEALQYAHEEKFIHRDVKPENMLVGRREAVLLSDFGIALIAQSSRYQSTQDVIGTIAYMSPEQIQGKPRPASDQYSLAIVVYEWLCGERPFHGSFSELCAQHTFATPTPLREKVPTILPEVEHVVLTALAKDPRQRFASVQAFATALEQTSQVEQGQVAALLYPPSQALPPSPQVLSQQHLHPPVVSPAVVSSASTLPASQDLPMTQPSSSERNQEGRPELQAPPSALDRLPPPMLPTQQAATPFPSRRPLLRKGFSWYRTALLVVLALLTIGGGGFIYNSVNSYNAHVQATATAAGQVTATGSQINPMWTATGNILLPRYSFPATTLPNGKVLIEGGFAPGSYTTDSELFDPTTGVWTQIGSLNQGRGEHSATLLQHGRVLVAGGYAGPVLNSAEIYDPGTSTWTLTGSMSQVRTRHTASLLQNGMVLVAGGWDGSPISSAELYNPAAGSWSSAGNMSIPRADGSAILLPNGEVLVAGGDFANSNGITGESELYDPGTNSWSATGRMNVARGGSTMVLLPNRKVLATGGSTPSGPTETAEIYDPATGTWTLTGNMQHARNAGLGQQAVLLKDGTVFIAGDDTVGTSEVYDPSNGTWGSLTTMVTKHCGAATALLPNGQLLIAGGTDCASSLTIVTELYGTAPPPTPSPSPSPTPHRQLIIFLQGINSTFDG